MASVIKGSDNFDSASVGKVLQVVSANVQASGSIAGSTPNEGNGLLLYAVNFTPISSSSKIIVSTSSVLVQEIYNSGNKMWLGAWADQYQIGVNSATGHYLNFANYRNTAYHSLNHSISSWGTFSRSIKIRAGGDNGTVYVNLQAYSDYTASQRELGITIMEIGA